MGEITTVDGIELSRVVEAYRDVLRAHQDELNRLNVYPVPDGDTGTNMALTIEAVDAELAGAHDLRGVCQAIAHGSLMGARGNSGVILSQILRGLCDTFATAGAVGPAELATGLGAATDAAYAAVMHPVEGTILTVVRSAADAARNAIDAKREATLADVVEAARTAAHDAVARSPQLLPVLAEAGVVDAGGRGLALLFDAWLHVLEGRPLPEAPVMSPGPVDRAPGPWGPPVGRTRRDLGPRYEVMFLLAAPDDTIPAFRSAWDALGESIVVVGGGGEWNCHVHTDDIGAAIEAALVAGRPSRLQVTDLWDQVERREADWVESAVAPATAACGVVAVASGTGVTSLLESLGVAVVVPGGQSMNPSTQEILDGVERVAAESVIVLPNNKNIVPVAEQVTALASRPVTVVPTHSVVEALAALLDFDPDRPSDANASAMRAAAARVRTGEVTQAVRDGMGACGPIVAGDWIAITRDGISARATSALDAAIAVVDRLVGESDELVTILVGADADPADVERLRAHLAAARPEVEVEIHDGGQPLYLYLVGVE
jgi:DAK2 domain fusion protein YloV